MTAVATRASVHFKTLDELLKFQSFQSNTSTLALPRDQACVATGLSIDEMKAQEESLLATGRWDCIPGLGNKYPLWFDTEHLRSRRPTITSSTRENARTSLNAYERYSKSNVWVELPDNSKRLELMDAANRVHPLLIEKAWNETDNEVSLGAVMLVASVLNLYFLDNAGFTSFTYAKLAKTAYCSNKVLNRALIVLCHTGLWGVLNGNGIDESRFYPLFIERSRTSFMGLVEQS